MNTPKYVKYFKTMLAINEDIAKEETVEQSAKCSSIIKKDIVLPTKLKDSENYTILSQFREQVTF